MSKAGGDGLWLHKNPAPAAVAWESLPRKYYLVYPDLRLTWLGLRPLWARPVGITRHSLPD